ncbi:uncharacterized protein LOC111057673 [Nilaparvata lugens]|uniref:uncharacterized protein LOC111057673 n=1 Tax=Nilaparvata lugens TaxID=108931 RepID=UPI00193CC1BB|nr:uncharacterized protein LOC111057673 [Nilaparvata lugens]XP_022200818.2 uncharacterized protein LOC111057673 [Nilaparvata lugens]XP_022200820.2 uncharacterized protein LOC111057673 [Nilaparvata lugens]XP_022200821.2 uncharacterized protein LOC111057673 [Nilaparvata lugens]
MELRLPDGLPSELDRFEGKAHGDHPPLKYMIQVITEDLIEDAVQHMTKYFLVRENILSSAAYLEDSVSMKVCHDLWRKILKVGVGLVALVELNEDGETKKKVAGINLTTIANLDDEKNSKDELLKLQGKAVKKTVRTVIDLEKDVDIASLYGTRKYLTAYGLSVAPQYSGDGVGYRLLMARTPLCRALGIRLTVTAFTSPLSQYLAKKAGFETVTSLDYKTYKHGDKLAYPRLDGSIALMAKRIPASCEL